MLIRGSASGCTLGLPPFPTGCWQPAFRADTPPLQVRKRKWDSYRSGEELFGLPVTQYPELERTEEEINMLDKLYRCGGSMPQAAFSTGAAPPLPPLPWFVALPPSSTLLPHPPDIPQTPPLPPCSLYVSVITTICGYGDYLWVDVVERVDAMASHVGGAGQAGAGQNVWSAALALQTPAAAHVEKSAVLLHRPRRSTSSRRSARSCRWRCATGRPTRTAGAPSTTSWTFCRCSRHWPTSPSATGEGGREGRSADIKEGWQQTPGDAEAQCCPNLWLQPGGVHSSPPATQHTAALLLFCPPLAGTGQSCRTSRAASSTWPRTPSSCSTCWTPTCWRAGGGRWRPAQGAGGLFSERYRGYVA